MNLKAGNPHLAETQKAVQNYDQIGKPVKTRLSQWDQLTHYSHCTVVPTSPSHLQIHGAGSLCMLLSGKETGLAAHAYIFERRKNYHFPVLAGQNFLSKCKMLIKSLQTQKSINQAFPGTSLHACSCRPGAASLATFQDWSMSSGGRACIAQPRQALLLPLYRQGLGALA